MVITLYKSKETDIKQPYLSKNLFGTDTFYTMWHINVNVHVCTLKYWNGELRQIEYLMWREYKACLKKGQPYGIHVSVFI